MDLPARVVAPDTRRVFLDPMPNGSNSAEELTGSIISMSLYRLTNSPPRF
jgi:hypothetical protein